MCHWTCAFYAFSNTFVLLYFCLQVRAAMAAAGGPSQLMEAVEKLAHALSLAEAQVTSSPTSAADGEGQVEVSRGYQEGPSGGASSGGGFLMPVENVLAAALSAPKVLTMPAAAAIQRASEVQAMIKASLVINRH